MNLTNKTIRAIKNGIAIIAPIYSAHSSGKRQAKINPTSKICPAPVHRKHIIANRFFIRFTTFYIYITNYKKICSLYIIL